MYHAIHSVIILVIKQIGLQPCGHPILLITRMITNRIGLHSVLLPLLKYINVYIAVHMSVAHIICSSFCGRQNTFFAEKI